MDVRKYTGKFTGKEAGYFLLTLAAALALWLYIAASNRKETIANISAGLTTINNFKNSEIRDWRMRRIREVRRLNEHPFLGEIVSEEISKPGSRREQLKTWLKGHTTHKMYSGMAFLSLNGTVIAASPGYHAAADKYLKDAFARSYREGAALLTDIHLSAEGRPCIEMISPIPAGGRGEKPICLLVIHIDPETDFYPLLKAAPLLYAKAETLLVRKEGEDVLFLNELNYRSGSALKLRHPLSDAGLPAAEALKGHTGFFAGIDYRGVKVFSAVSHIEDSGWAVVTKIDRDEVLAPVKARERLQLALLLTVACLLYIVAYYILTSRRLAAQKSLAESETNYRELVDASGDGILTADLESMKFSFANQAICRMLGYTAEELTALSVTDIHPKDALPSVIAEFEAQARGEKTLAPDLPCLRKDGTIFYADITTTPVTIDGRKYNLGIFRDITEIKQMQLVNLARLRLIQYSDTHPLDELLEEALNEAEKLTGSLIGFYHFVEADQKTLSLQNWSTRTKGEYCKAEGKGSHYGIDKAGVWVNCVHTRKPVIHNDYASLPDKKGLPPGHAPLIREMVVPVMREGKVVSIMGVGNKPVDYNEKDVQVLSMLADLSWEVVNRKLAENKLRESQRIFSEFMEHSPVYVFFKDKDLKFLHLSRNYEKMLGRPMEELLGKSVDDLFPSDLAKSMIEDDKRILAEWKEVIVEEEMNGRSYRTIKFPIKIEGQAPYLAGYTLDITDQKRSDMMLRAEKDRAQSYLELVGVIILTLDANQSITLVNRKCCEMLGYTREELIGKNWFDLVIPAEQREAVKDVFNKIISGNLSPAEYFENDVITHAGERRTIAWTNRERRNAEGNIVGLLTSGEDITEQKRAMEAIRESEQRLKEAQHLAKIGNWKLDLVSNKLEWSDEIYAIFEIDQKKFGASYEAFLNIIHPEDRDTVNRAYTDSVKNRTKYDIVHRLLMKDGRVKYVNEFCESFYDPGGRPIASVGMVQDITERKLAEEKLRESEERLRVTLEETQIGTWDWDLTTDTWIASPTYYTMLGYAPEKGPSDRKVWMERAHPEDRSLIAQKVGAVLNGADAKYQYEARIKHADGTYRWVAVLGNTVKRDKNGKPARIMGVRMDITGRKKAGEKLRKNERNLLEAQRLARIGSWEWDAISDKITWSAEYYEIFGFDPAKSPPGYVEHLKAYTPESAARLDAAVKKNIQTGEPYELDLELAAVKEPRQWITARSETVRDAQGKIIGLRGTAQDITERKRSEMEKEQLNRDLAARRQEMENFLYITTHDLRSPLVNIQGFTQNLVRYLQELRDRLAPAGPSRAVDDEVAKLAGERIPEALKYVLESSRKMDSLITSLLKVARLGRVEMKPVILDMNDLVKRITDSIRFQGEKAGVSIKTGVLPLCRADKTAVSQIFANLLGNAIKYKHRDRALEISVTGEIKGARVTYTVADNGSGIAPRDLPKIWDLFYRGRGAGMEGEGIGLTVVKHMAEKNGGSVKVESREGQWSAFSLELPAAGGVK